jgi:hypothetical protein
MPNDYDFRLNTWNTNIDTLFSHGLVIRTENASKTVATYDMIDRFIRRLTDDEPFDQSLMFPLEEVVRGVFLQRRLAS